jgi:hypothetical protein
VSPHDRLWTIMATARRSRRPARRSGDPPADHAPIGLADHPQAIILILVNVD